MVVNVAAMVARIAWGLVSDRQFQGKRQPVLVIIVALTVCSTLGAALIPSQTSLWLVAVLAILVGAESAGTAISLVQGLSTPATLLAPPLFGLLADVTGSYRMSWLVLTLIGTVGLLTLRWVSEKEIA